MIKRMNGKWLNKDDKNHASDKRNIENQKGIIIKNCKL